MSSIMQGSPADRMFSLNAARSVDRAQSMYENRPVSEDVSFDLIEQDKIAYGQPFNVQFLVQVSTYLFFYLACYYLYCYCYKQNRSQETRTISAVLSANSVYYTGVVARRLGRTDCQFVLQPGGRKPAINNKYQFCCK